MSDGGPDAAGPRGAGLLSARIAERVREEILTGELRPGQRIPERQLTERLRVSRTPLREALKMLTVEGLVVHHPNRGAIVADPSPAEIQAAVEFVRIVESAAGRLACARATAAEIDEISARHFEMKAALLRGDVLGYYRLNRAIHRGIVDAAHNPVLSRQHALVDAGLYRIRFLPHRRGGTSRETLAEHDAIDDALRARDGDLLARLLFEHHGRTWTRYETWLREQGEPAAATGAPDREGAAA